jgi:hypothetical protein
LPASEWVFLKTNMNETRLVRSTSKFPYYVSGITSTKNVYTEKFSFIRVQSHLSRRASSYMMKRENVGPMRKSVSSFMTFDPFEKICKTIQEPKKGETNWHE